MTPNLEGGLKFPGASTALSPLTWGPWVLAEPCMSVCGAATECQSLWGHSPCDSSDKFPNGPVMQWLQPYLEAWLLPSAAGLVHGLGGAHSWFVLLL